MSGAMHRRAASSSHRITIADHPPRSKSPFGARSTSHSATNGLSIFSFRRIRPLRLIAILVCFGFIILLFGPEWAVSVFGSRRNPHDDGGPPGPTVARGVMDRLRDIEYYLAASDDSPMNDTPGMGGEGIHVNDDDEATLEDDGHVRPPKVGELPGEAPKGKKPYRPSADSSQFVEAASLDAQFCPEQAKLGRPCAFLFPAFLGEQETKAQQHLYQLGLLAISLNRTLVLPNVHRSRMSSCSSYPFEFYYANNSLSALRIPTISQADLMDWVSLRDPAPSAQIVAMIGQSAAYPQGAVEIDSAANPREIPGKPTRKLCLDKTRLNFDQWSSLAVYPPTGWHKTRKSRLAFGDEVVNTMRSDEVVAKAVRTEDAQGQPLGDKISTSPTPDVLVFNFELRFPILEDVIPPDDKPWPAAATLDEVEGTEGALASGTLPFRHFPYSDTWINLAALLARSLSPFVAVHWRTETLLPNQMRPCAAALLDKIREIATEHKSIQTVYLATDYPLEDLETGREGVAPHSGTFVKYVTEEHHKAMADLLKAFNEEELGVEVRLSTYAREQSRVVLPPELERALAPAHEQNMEGVKIIPSRQQSQVATGIPLADLDPGLLGIVDKAVAMRAEIFLTGWPGEDIMVAEIEKDRSHSQMFEEEGATWAEKMAAYSPCGKVSSFTRQIIEARKAKREKVLLGEEEDYFETSGLWNNVEYWGEKIAQ